MENAFKKTVFETYNTKTNTILKQYNARNTPIILKQYNARNFADTNTQFEIWVCSRAVTSADFVRIHGTRAMARSTDCNKS